jgi:hypothetical protein
MAAEQEHAAPRRRPVTPRRDGELRSRSSTKEERPRKPKPDAEMEHAREPTKEHATHEDSPSEKEHYRPRRLTTTQLAQCALFCLRQLTTRDIEAVVGISRKDNGNVVVVLEVVESHHFPDSSDLLAEYAVEVDSGGELVGYVRGDRYQRGRPGGS